jgi:cytochrome c-type biogenesis protein CcmH/NrfG
MKEKGYSTMAEGLCNERHENIKKEQDRTERRLNGHSNELKELSKLVYSVIAIQEQQAKTQELLLQNLQALTPKNDVKKKVWYESDIGKFLIKSGVALLFLVIIAAIGLNLSDALKVYQGIKP